uniref:NADH dehydrogenase subunit 2 n=1 Tax=Angiostrongylus vasorum TaxID=321387 RepID=J7G051_ANGVA|nr:NADH dehydrogenase subunit 2 [Angiostrongylus vasorum]AFP58676.1 NADH dehydrogenase subunit 2 [Angiostrongylus vasorum]
MYLLFFFLLWFWVCLLWWLSMFFWWSVFLVMTLLIIFMNKKVFGYSSIFNYFVLQESLGLLFLLLFFDFFPVLILMVKIGVAPFHFWLFKVVGGMSGVNLVWFLTVHKLPFTLVFVQLFCLNMVFFCWLVWWCVCFSYLGWSHLKNMLVVSSVESFSWVVSGLVMSFFNVVYLFFYYLVLMMFLLYKFDLMGGLSSGFSWELVLVFMNMPFSVGFFVKIMMLMEFLKSFGVYMILILFVMFMSVLSLSFWLVILSVKKLLFNKYSVLCMIYCFPLMLMVLL